MAESDPTNDLKNFFSKLDEETIKSTLKAAGVEFSAKEKKRDLETHYLDEVKKCGIKILVEKCADDLKKIEIPEKTSVVDHIQDEGLSFPSS
jgi:hypothetical protein